MAMLRPAVSSWRGCIVSPAQVYLFTSMSPIHVLPSSPARPMTGRALSMSIPDPTTPSDQAAAHQEGRHDLDRILRASHHSDLARLLSLLTLVIASSVIVGWMFGSPHLVSLAPGLPTMKLNTAIAASLLAVALMCLSANTHPTRWRRWLVYGCCAIASSLAISALIEHATGRLHLVDVAILDDPFTPTHSGPPGLMSQAAAIGLILTSVAILARSTPLVLACSTLAAAIASTAAAAFLFRAGGLTTIPFFSSLAVVSAFSSSCSTLPDLSSSGGPARSAASPRRAFRATPPCRLVPCSDS